MSARLCNNVIAVTFVSKHKAACQPIADQLDVPVENILGLAAQESQYGSGRIARELNNYFSLHAPAPLQIGEEAPMSNARIKVAKRFRPVSGRDHHHGQRTVGVLIKTVTSWLLTVGLTSATFSACAASALPPEQIKPQGLSREQAQQVLVVALKQLQAQIMSRTGKTLSDEAGQRQGLGCEDDK